MAETHALWSWDDSNQRWLEISQGSLAEMRGGSERRYGAAKRLGMSAAFVVRKRGDAPHLRPQDLNVEVVQAATEKVKTATVQTTPVALAREYRLAELIYTETNLVAKTLPFDNLPPEAQEGYVGLIRRIAADLTQA